jgi:uncharacterized protein YceK
MNNLAITLLLVLMAGCATVTPNYDTKFGDAVRQAKLKMTINPGAGRNSDAVAGMDGIATRDSIILYQDSFKAPPPVVNVINIGGGLTGGGGGK